MASVGESEGKGVEGRRKALVEEERGFKLKSVGQENLDGTRG